MEIHMKYKYILLSMLIPGVMASANAFNLVSLVDNLGVSRASTAPATGEVEVSFSPDEGGEALVLKVIGSAKHSLRVMAYSFTSKPVVKALLDAKRRGVDVQVMVDHKSNVTEDRSGKAKAALNLLVNAGIPTRTISVYPIFHDKTIVADGQTVETGSFNYSYAAAHRNSENVLVLWNNPKIAAAYLEHWQSRFRRGVDYRSTY